MKFSICIPNFNYERYIGRTIRSVLEQSHEDLEILIADNASTDRSVEVIQSIKDARIHVRVNACNVGFAGNLDRAASNAGGDCMSRCKDRNTSAFFVSLTLNFEPATAALSTSVTAAWTCPQSPN